MGIRSEQDSTPSEEERSVTKREWALWMCRVLGRYYSKKGYAVSRECSIPTLVTRPDGTTYEKVGNPKRADFMAISKRFEEVVMVETKSCPADFHSDDKWPEYLRCCTKLYFAADKKTAEYIVEKLKAHEHGYTVGVIVIPEDTTATMSYQLEPHVIKMARRRKLGVPVKDLLWRMTARNSGFTWTGIFQSGNAFEHHETRELGTNL